VRSTIAQEIYSRLPTTLAAISLFFSVAAVLVTIGLMRTMYRDDILRQITNAKLSCVSPSGQSSVFDCKSFWTDTTTTISTTEYLDNHHPFTAFWLMVAASLLSLYLFVFLRRRRETISLHEDFVLARRLSEEEKMRETPGTV